MHSSDSNEGLPVRRKLLGGMISAAALLGLNTASAAASSPAAAPALIGQPETPDELFALARLRNYTTRRSSSWDRTGGNRDATPVEPGQAATLLDITGAGVVTHIWFTIASSDPMHLKNLVLRAWWDGESTPSVETPIGDFFGLGLGEYFVRSEGHTSELQSRQYLVCRLLLEKKKQYNSSTRVIFAAALARELPERAATVVALLGVRAAAAARVVERHRRVLFFFFFFNDAATPEIYPSPLHDALPICVLRAASRGICPGRRGGARGTRRVVRDRKSTRLNSSHANISYAVFCLKKK